MRIGVISDTHLHDCDERLDRLTKTHFYDVDLILHAGDLVDIRVLNSFNGKNIKAVHGNMDPPSVKSTLPDRLILEIFGHRIGLIHGWGMPFDLEKRLLNELNGIDCLVYGHSHKPVNKMQDGVLLFNPGSATDKHFTRANTIGILEIDDQIEGKIIRI